MSAHTPGPWKIGTPPPNGEQTVGTDQGLMVAVATTGAGVQTKANARLIAAAPELLEFAKWAMGQFCGDSGTGESHWEQFEEFRKGQSAIAKAESES